MMFVYLYRSKTSIQTNSYRVNSYISLSFCENLNELSNNCADLVQQLSQSEMVHAFLQELHVKSRSTVNSILI